MDKIHFFSTIFIAITPVKLFVNVRPYTCVMLFRTLDKYLAQRWDQVFLLGDFVNLFCCYYTIYCGVR